MRKQRGKGRPPGAQGGQGQPQQGGGQRPGGHPPQSAWAQTRDSLRRDLVQASMSLAFAERFNERLETQRRLYQDFPRVMEAQRSGALERLGTALGHIYEDGRGQTVDLQRFLRDLPLATAHLALRDRAQAQSAMKAAAAGPAAESAPEAAGAAESAASAGSAPAESEHAGSEAAGSDAAGEAESAAAESESAAESEPAAESPAEPTASESAPQDEAPAAPSTESASGAAATAAAPPSPRLELRSRLLTAAPQLAKAAVAYRRNVATVRRACSPRRGPGPWRSDREVLEEARRAVEFAQKLYDTYAEAWADEPLEKTGEAVSAEVDRFLAWTQLDRYAELAMASRLQQQSAAAPKADKSDKPAEPPAAAPEPPDAGAASESQGPAA